MIPLLPDRTPTSRLTPHLPRHMIPRMDIRELINKILADGKLTSVEQEQLLEAINADGKINAAENEQVRRVLSMIHEGKLVVE